MKKDLEIKIKWLKSYADKLYKEDITEEENYIRTVLLEEVQALRSAILKNSKNEEVVLLYNEIDGSVITIEKK